MKQKRQNEILKIIGRVPIKTHDELIAALADSGYIVTQATVSRDIKELGLVKTSSGDGGLRYADPRVGSVFNPIGSEDPSVFAEVVLSITPAMHTIVIRTLPGMASGIASIIDRLSNTDILGTVAGDDTVLVITANSDTAPRIAHLLCKTFSIR